MANGGVNSSNIGDENSTSLEGGVLREQILKEEQGQEEITKQSGAQYPGSILSEPTLVSNDFTKKVIDVQKGINDVPDVTELNPAEVIPEGKATLEDSEIGVYKEIPELTIDDVLEETAVDIKKTNIGKKTPPPLPKIVTPPPLPSTVPPPAHRKKTRIIESASADSTPEIIITEELIDMDEQELELEKFFKKEKLEVQDAYILADLICKYYHSRQLQNFLKKIAPTESDYKVFFHNINLDQPGDIPILIQKILIVGHLQDPASGLYLYQGDKLQHQGHIGEITKALMASKEDLTLKVVLVKRPQNNAISKGAFRGERDIAKQVAHHFERNPDHPGAKHVLVPIYTGQDYIVMPLIKDEQGNTDTLLSLARMPNREKDWINGLIGAMKGGMFLNENGLINTDMKPANICYGKQGGVLIDWGGFYNPEENMEYSSTLQFMCNTVMTVETLGGKEAQGNTHKFILYRMLERKFLLNTDYPLQGDRKGKDSQEERRRIWKEFAFELDEHGNQKVDAEGDPIIQNDRHKFDYPPLEYDVTSLQPADQLLYELYRKLHKSHHHPYQFLNNIPANGINAEYMSVPEVIAKLEKIASYL